MIGVYDFCGYYDWTFEWLRQQGGEALVRQYWDEAIHQDSQRHAAELIQEHGFAADHEHNHCGQCWWEIRRLNDHTRPSEPGTLAGSHDVRLSSDWGKAEAKLDVYHHSNHPDDKVRE